MTAAGLRRSVRATPRRDLTLVLLLGAAGAGLVLLATRQGWADVQTAAPRPLPAGVITESGQALAPAASALAVAALAGLAAVLATRRMVRRVAGVVLAAFGAGIAAAVSAGISAADVLAAASGSVSSQAAAGAGTAGSTTAGTSGAGAGPLSGFPSHVVFAGFPWRPIAVVGAIAVMAAGALVAWRADRLPVMSGRFERPAPSAGARASRAAAQQAERGSQGPVQRGPQGAGQRGPERADSAAMWESLSRGEDPTSPG
jgi:uncharacterized membrane protein (TIGR02234 family)